MNAHAVSPRQLDGGTIFNDLLPACSECDGVGVWTTGREIYPHRPDLHDRGYYRCRCGAYVGCHPGTVKALGTPAGPDTRRARTAAHAAFDPLWKGGSMTRSAAYQALAAQLGLRSSVCHISWFNVEQCRHVMIAVDRIKRGAPPAAMAVAS